jgi:hypothetical protein
VVRLPRRSTVAAIGLSDARPYVSGKQYIM